MKRDGVKLDSAAGARIRAALKEGKRATEKRLKTGSKQRDRDNKGGNPRNFDSRNMRMARKFLRRRQAGSLLKATALKVEIGEAYGLKRSAAIAAVNAGLLKISSGEAS